MTSDVEKRSDGARPRNEVPYTLDEPAPKVLGFWDQSAFWANLGVSLLAFSGAYTVLAPDAGGRPTISIMAGIVAMAAGTILGGLMLGLAAVPGTRTGQPAMVLLRGLFGAKLSYAPTVLNIAQLVGWGTFELIVIADAARELWDGVPRWGYVVAAGAITTVLTVWPLGSVRLLRRYVTVAVVVALVYFYVQLLREPIPDLTRGSWGGFWIGADAALAVSISWVPVAADYTRHAKTERGAFGAAAVGYSVTQIVAYVLGLLALALVAGDSGKVFDPFLGATLGVVFFAVFVLREADQSFADTYSTAVSIQNLFPRADRRVLSVGLGAGITVLALALDIGDYAGFLSLIGSVFVPMLGVLAADFFLGRRARGGWDVSRTAPSRWGMIVAWAAGFVVYQLINPGTVERWAGLWRDVQEALHFTPQSWMSASLLSFLVAGLAALLIGRLTKR
ncbi:purine-cytosine permease family protein [Actinomadura madurae]|uniref:purine-cytosine permease family protein n=1 Tax=Actinomadura madurae TaxID=1993 RepID=UPI002026306C|nr:cytosine permease [Actinomadura madurae]MCP9968817.1 cytosine permease [Actinomadura madurae]MCQ0007199.1 cytosine permease [Actinomadura madurae]MCQ0017493.1 cytosine permease [Actinomadura madurae]URM97586.1 cytosine permease [Actinomadura madurae]URN08276.1 cytosine permease [Actinomadura madurae]